MALTGRDVEQRHFEILAAVKAAVSLPVAVKIGPYFSAPAEVARGLAQGGADALVLFNRFYQPDIDIATLRLTADLELSTSAEIRLPLLWIALLRGRLGCSLAASTGVQSADEVFKYLLVGADVVMTTSSLLRHGVQHMRTLVEGVSTLLEARGIARVDEVRGQMSYDRLPAGEVTQRRNYMQILRGYA
jgi:dihydroorotate dehydrogenase (fumarate)